jgi:hypothetical protein
MLPCQEILTKKRVLGQETLIKTLFTTEKAHIIGDKMGKSYVLLLVLVLAASSILVVKSGLSSADVAEDSWVAKAPLEVARMRLGVAVVNGKIYAIGGDTLSLCGNCLSAYGYGPVVGANEEYDPTMDTWTRKASMPTPRTHFGVAVYQNKIYCIGGQGSDGKTNVNEVYDPKTDSWETEASMPTPRAGVSANVVNGKIYVISNGANEVYNPVTNSWTTKKPPPCKITTTGSFVVSGKIYFIGGVDSTPVRNVRVRIYNTVNDSWSYGGFSPEIWASASAGRTTSEDNPVRVYFFDESSTHIYTPANDSWTSGTPMQKSRGYAGVATINDTFYLVGGIFAPFKGYIVITGPASTNEQYIPSEKSVNVDNIKPNISLVSPQNKTYFTPEIALNFTVDESLSWTRYSLDGQEVVKIDGNTTLVNLSYGLHNLTVFCTDTSGNTGSSETIHFAIEAPEPFPTTTVVFAVVLVAVTGSGLLIYFKKRNRIRVTHE